MKVRSNMTEMIRPLVLIPAAGFGRRVGSPHAKELLLGPDNNPMIDYPIQQALKRDWPVLVITRPQKIELVNHLKEKWGFGLDKNRQLMFINESTEWPDTLLQSHSLWLDWNMVLLPDVSYQPLDILDQMLEKLNSNTDGVVASHSVPPDQSVKWGFLNPHQKGLWLAEKPSHLLKAEDQAWGIYCFHRRIGQPLLQAQLQHTLRCAEQEWSFHPWNLAQVFLHSFEDLTRGGSK
ncbi:MAG: sugar phosphate nucleotidyltransferase [Pseudobdellovibrionaceae bacterium]